MRKFETVCSCCGVRSRMVSCDSHGAAQLFEEGWGSRGSALYCPRCSESWASRNGTRPLDGRICTVLTILDEMLRN